MTTFPPVKLISYLTYTGVLFHVFDGLVLTLRNRKSRPSGYVVERGSANASFASRNMGVLGTIILVFLVTHMQNFWYRVHFDAAIPMQGELKDLHTVVLTFFNPAENPLAIWAVLGYVVAQAARAFHLLHGFQSATSATLRSC